MSSTSVGLPQKLIVFGIVLPIAALVGLLLTSPDFLSLTVVGLFVFVLCIPLLMRWHHALLIVTWHASITVFFLPGQPELWMLMAAISIVFTVANRWMNKEQASLYVPSVVWPLLFLSLVVLITMKLTGGFGLRSLGGSTYGGRRYFYILAAVLGYFALTGQRVPPQRALLYATLFFLSAVTAVISNLAFFGGPAFYFLYWIFPASLAIQQAYAEWSVASTGMLRLTGIAFAAPAIYYALFLRYGFRGVLASSKVWRLFIFLALLFLSLLGGFRSAVVTLGLLVFFLFYFEKLFRTRLFLVGILLLLLGGAALVPLARHLPLSVQRSISFLPIEVDPRAVYDAQGSMEWRLRIWNVLLPQVPKYFWIGKGCSIDPIEFSLLGENTRRWYSFVTDFTIASGSYHNGPLTLLIPFGIFGLLGFLWFAFACLRILHRHYAHGPPELKRINTFLLAYFCMRLAYFLVFYGQFAEDLFLFTGLIGLGISLNGVIEKPKPGFEHAVAEPRLDDMPSGQLVRTS